MSANTWQWIKEILGYRTKCQKRGHLWIKDFYSYGFICGRRDCSAYMSAEEAHNRGWVF